MLQRFDLLSLKLHQWAVAYWLPPCLRCRHVACNPEWLCPAWGSCLATHPSPCCCYLSADKRFFPHLFFSFPALCLSQHSIKKHFGQNGRTQCSFPWMELSSDSDLRVPAPSSCSYSTACSAFVTQLQQFYSWIHVLLLVAARLDSMIGFAFYSLNLIFFFSHLCPEFSELRELVVLFALVIFSGSWQRHFSIYTQG